MSLIELSQIEKNYGAGSAQHRILRGIDLQIEQGEFVAIMGASGSGKSTLMNIIGLLDKPSSGEYRLNDRPVNDLSDDELANLRNHSIGFVFQQFYLLPRLTALENVALPLSYRTISVADRLKLAKNMLNKVGMEDRLQHMPNQLSGGQQQRVAIARALVTDPKMILADEPTGALDSKTGDEVMGLFKRLNREDKTTVVLVTHDPEIAKQCQRIIHIRDGQLQ